MDHPQALDTRRDARRRALARHCMDRFSMRTFFLLAALASNLPCAGAQDPPEGPTRQGFEEYEKTPLPIGPAHAALRPIRDGLAADVERLRHDAGALLARLDQAVLEAQRVVVPEDDAERALVLGELYLTRGKLRRMLGGRRGDEAELARGYRDVQAAQRSFAVLERQPQWRFHGVLGLGRCEAVLGRRVEALRRFEAAIESDPLHEETYLAKARIYLDADQPEQALLEIESGLLRIPREIHLRLEHLALRIAQGQDLVAEMGAFAAEADRRDDVALRSRVAALELQQALILVRRPPSTDDEEARARHYERVRLVLERAVQHDAGNAEAWFYLAELKAEGGRWQGAVLAYSKAIDLGCSERDRARFERARLVAVSYGTLLDSDRRATLGWMHDALALETPLAEREITLDGMKRRMVQEFEEARRAALVALEGERFEEARDRFEDALAVDPGNPFLLSYLGMCLEESGESARAREVYETARRRAIELKQDVWWPFVALETFLPRDDIQGRHALANAYLDAFPEGERADYFRSRLK
ncbi:MAG: tetratricopeptide repeat protein [Planctomycetes bacterium]|nr:tetratricopeptide repeat protein [Planctomycetota bacterium]